jgi:DNA polymerase
MRDTEKILKSLALAGVEWELEPRAGPHGAARNDPGTAAAPGFSAPKALAPVSAADILKIAKRRAEHADIVEAIKGFAEHPLHKSARNTVCPAIAGDCRLMVITDAPSLADDRSGTILSGDEGELLDKMLAAIGLSRESVSITPLVFWRPAGGRAPTADEIAWCRPFVEKITAACGKILTLGALAAKEIAGASLPREHGKVFGNVVPIYKPDFIIQNPAVKKDVWNALQVLKSA